MEVRDVSDTQKVAFYRSPQFLGVSAIALALSMYLLFVFV
jgi:hypothetical protein